MINTNANDLVLGATYRVHIFSNTWVTATFTGTHVAGFATSLRTHYCFTDLRTGRNITVKSRAKIGSQVSRCEPPTQAQINSKSLGEGDNG